MKTYREIAEMHYGSEPSNEVDREYRARRISALEKLLSEQLGTSSVVGQSEQLVCHGVIHHMCKHFSITGCNGCKVKNFEEK